MSIRPSLGGLVRCLRAALCSVCLWGLGLGSTAAIEPLKVMTLNVGHGRGDALHQAVISNSRVLENLEKVAFVLERESPHVLATQEVDERAWWSGKVNQPRYIADLAGYQYAFWGRHMERVGLRYGTALLARVPLSNSLSYRFSPAALTPPKGFVIATIEWPGCPGVKVDVASVHFDFMRERVRLRQAEELRNVFERRDGLRIVLGDLNTERQDTAGVLEYLTGTLGMKAYERSDDLVTFPPLGKQFDWILISEDLSFSDYTVLPAHLSDHRAVIAQIVLGGRHLGRCGLPVAANHGEI